MTPPITTDDLARAAIRYVKASIARAKFDQGTAWLRLSRDEWSRAQDQSYALHDEEVSARTALYGLVGRYEAQEGQG
jgi:hypothetical protein